MKSVQPIGSQGSVAPTGTAGAVPVVSWYGPLLALLTAVPAAAATTKGYAHDANGTLIYSIVIASLLLLGADLFKIQLPLGRGAAHFSVGSIVALGVAIWLGPTYTAAIYATTAFIASVRHLRNFRLALENAASVALSTVIAGWAWWALVPEGAVPLTSIRTSWVLVVAAALYSVINFGTVVIATALANREPVLRLALKMSGGKSFIFTIPVLGAFIPLIGSQSPIALLFFAVPLVSSHLALRAIWRLETDTQTTLAALTDILELRDPYTAFHSERVSIYTVAIARRMPEVTSKDLATLERAARIHDIGKAAVRDAVLLKNGPLTDDERRSIESHSSIGADLIARMFAYRDCIELIRHHHERWDGGGYPSRLIAGRIPLGARIMAVADSLDAMTTDRPYRKALTFDAAVAEIKRNSRTQYDPDVVDAFLMAIDDPAFQQLSEDSRLKLAAD